MQQSLESDLYHLFMEKLLDDLEADIFLLKAKIMLLEAMKSEKKDQIEYPEWKPSKVVKSTFCSKCGLKLDQVLGYCCPDAKCPCGLGPVMCGVLATTTKE